MYIYPGNLLEINIVSGEITVANNAILDFELTPEIEFTVVVVDGGSPAQSDEVTSTLVLLDVNEPPSFGDPSALMTQFTIDENSNFGSSVTGSLTAIDPDANDEISYLVVKGGDFFGVNAVTGKIYVAVDNA